MNKSMTVKNRLIRSLSRREGEVTRQELARIGSSAQLTRALSQLVEEGRVERVGHGRYRYLSHESFYSLDRRYLVKDFDFQTPRFWSAPGIPVEGEKIVKSVLLNPVITDLIKIVRQFGQGPVRKIWDTIVSHREINENTRVYVDAVLKGVCAELKNAS